VNGDGKIASLRLSPARSPSDLPRAEALTEEQVAERRGGFVDRLAARDAFSGTLLLAKVAVMANLGASAAAIVEGNARELIAAGR
jgi:hypothetical protein